VGQEVTYPVLQTVAALPEEELRRGLRHLQTSEFFYERSLVPEPVYAFKHVLTQEAAYQSLPHRTRRHYHARIAEVLTAQWPETVTHQPELLAHHYTQAGLPAQALPYWQHAGQWALQRSANQEAFQHLTTGLTLLATLPETRARA